MTRPVAFDRVPVERASAAVAAQLRAAILDGRYPEGGRLLERDLVEQFGVSRITVRDALRSLEAMGLIEMRLGARGGAFVTVPSGDVMAQTMLNLMTLWSVAPEDVVEARLVVELGTVTLACSRATEDDLARLREHCERSREALEAKRYARELSWEFHTHLAEAAHNGATEALTHAFHSSLRRIPSSTRQRNRALALTVEEHVRIVDAVEDRDATAARRAMAEHILRGTGMEERADALVSLWDTPPRRPSRRRAG